MKAIFAMLVILAICDLPPTFAQSWGYDASNGPPTWSADFPVCDDTQQSPINIIGDQAEVNYTLTQFTRNLFGTHPSSMRIFNNGHTVQVDMTDAYIINDITLLPGSFRAAQFHLHWALPGEKGSEHTFNGIQYFAELHIVHYNTRYASLGEAASQPDGIAVLGIFIEDDYPQDNLAFNRLLNLVTNGSVVYDSDSYTYDQQFSVETLLPPDLDVYYRYRGSLTTPPCYESVTWTVFDSILHISRNQAVVLETMLFENVRDATDENRLYGNFRPPQPLNGRQVTRSPRCDRSASSVMRPVFVFVALLSMITTTLLFH